jgi:ketosteroid isomerase-like protein
MTMRGGKRMKIGVAVGILLSAFVLGIVVLARTKTMDAEQQLLKLDHEWSEADLKNDHAVVERILAADYVLIDSSGRIWTKAECIALGKSGEDEITSIVDHEQRVRVYGDAAVIVSRRTIKEIVKGKSMSGQYRTTDTWVKLAGRWQCVATHSSRMSPK